MTEQETLAQIRVDRARGELLGPLTQRYGAAAIAEAFGVLPLAAALGVEPAKTTAYRVGKADIYDDPEEEVYIELADAEAAAIALSYADDPIAIWDQDGECVGIVFQQRAYWP